MSTIHPTPGAGKLDLDKIRQDFPILKRKVHGHPLIYLDNAATSQRAQPVLGAINHYYTQCGIVRRSNFQLLYQLVYLKY